MLPLPVVILAFLLLPLGYARVAAFVINRSIFGHRDDLPIMKWLAMIVPPFLLLMSLLLIPFFREFHSASPSHLAVAGKWWLLGSAAAGIVWIVERAWVLTHQQRIATTEHARGEVIALRKAHVRNALLKRLGLHNDVYDLEVNLHRVRVRDLPPPFEGYRIAFLSDLHVAPFMRRSLYRACIDEIRAARVDLIALGGDFVSFRRHVPLIREYAIDGLEARDGIFAVLGNHDYWTDAAAIVDSLAPAGVQFLGNGNLVIERGDAAIALVAIEEIYRGKPDVAAAFAAIPADRPRIVLSHHPDVIDLIGDERADLLLCGHTHGGQICFPYFGPLIVPSRYETRYAAGFFRLRNLLMYVGRGVGAVPPVRILCRPELAIFELTNGDRTTERSVE